MKYEGIWLTHPGTAQFINELSQKRESLMKALHEACASSQDPSVVLAWGRYNEIRKLEDDLRIARKGKNT